MDRTTASPITQNAVNLKSKELKRFKPYPAYKDSGVEWLGRIPVHWEVKPLKRLGSLQAGAGFPHDLQGFLDQELPFYKVVDMESSTDGKYLEFKNTSNTISFETAKLLRAFVFPPNAVVFAKVGAALLGQVLFFL